MSPNDHRVLLVDDDPHVLSVLVELFNDDYALLSAQSGAEAIERVQGDSDVAVAVLDIKMAEMNGITTARQIREIDSSIRVIFHTGYPGEYDEDEIDQAETPFDYVVKGRSSTRLMRSVRNAYESHLMDHKPGDLVREAERNYGLIGASSAMQEIYRLIGKVARANTKVMILGETGTGKEVVARAIHANSKRRDNKFGIVNCNHKSTELVEAELFGYKKGAFTGAASDRQGLFSVATGGTVFLDEIGDLSSTTQMALLRVLETGECRQMGPEGEDYRTDVRVLCATHRNLEELVEDNTFREDLYYRLRGAVMSLPPLRHRREDIPILVERFRDQITLEQGLPFTVLDSDALGLLINHDWPGNVRQLRDTVESLIVLADSELISADEVARFLGNTEGPARRSKGGLSSRMKEVEKALILEALVESNYSISDAAMLLDVERSTLSRKIKGHGIDVTLLAKRDKRE